MLAHHMETVMKRFIVATVATLGMLSTASAQTWINGAYVASSPGYAVVHHPYAPPVYVNPQPVYVVPAPQTYVVPPQVVYSAPQQVYAPQPAYQPNYGGILAATALIGGAAALISTGHRHYGGHRSYHRGHHRY